LLWPTKIWLEGVCNIQRGSLNPPIISLYDFDLLNINPLKDLIERFVDFEAIRNCQAPKLFVSATNVETGKLRIFPQDKITAEVVAASACLPTLFRAVEIDGVPYWDGGYLGNPSISPLLRTATSEDVLLVQLNPLQCRGAPTSIAQILRRLNEITFNSSLMSELHVIEVFRRLIDEGRLHWGAGPAIYKRVNMHRIVLDAFDKELDPMSPVNIDYEFFEMLRENGRDEARRFLDAHFEDIGVRERWARPMKGRLNGQADQERVHGYFFNSWERQPSDRELLTTRSADRVTRKIDGDGEGETGGRPPPELTQPCVHRETSRSILSMLSNIS